MEQENDAPTQQAQAPCARRSKSVHASLVWLVLACLLPGALGSCLVLYASYRSERAQIEHDTLHMVRALTHEVDAELRKATVAAQTLATSPHLAARNFAAFHAQAQDAIRKTAVGNNFVLSDASGQQLVNTIRPFPGPLPRHGNPAQLHRVFDAGRNVVSDVYIGGVLRRPVMSIDVPVWLDGKVAYDLSVGLFPEGLEKVVRAERLPPEWVVAVFDTQGVIAARSHAADRFVGQKGAPALLQRMSETAEGWVDTATVEGIQVAAVFSRSPVSHWTVAIGIPAQELTAELRQRFLLLLLAVAVLFALGLMLAAALAERIAQSIRALTEPALALGSGKPVVVPRVYLREAEEVGAAIVTASQLLVHRTTELEAANKELQDFSYAISHDLTSPLRAIAGYAQIVAQEHAGQLDEEGRRLLDRVREGTVRMGRLIDSLVEFMDIARRRLDWVEVDMDALVRAEFERQSAALPQRRLRLDLGELPPAWGDSAMLRRVLEQLIANAIKFIPAEAAGVLAVSGETVGAQTRYHLRDNGVGFDMRYAGKLFRAFERLHPPGTCAGLGVGLALVKRIVGRHGGQVWAAGEVGAGATFHFALPVR